MPSLKLSKPELKALDALLSNKKNYSTAFGFFGEWFPKQLSKVILKVSTLSKRYNIHNNPWKFSFSSQVKQQLNNQSNSSEEAR